MNNKETKLVGLKRIDDLGRIMLTKEFRNKIGIKEGDLLRVEADDTKIVIKKFDERENILFTLGNLRNRIERLETINPNAEITYKDKIIYNIEIIESLLNQMEI